MPTSRPVALITGASRGIGRAIAVELAPSHRVVGTWHGHREAAESLQRETGAVMMQSDIASAADRGSLLEFVETEYGQIDLLVNNAGIAPRVRRDMLEATEDSFDEILATNLKGPHFLTQGIARLMMRQAGGRIVFITSISSYTASVNRADYCLSKAALSMSVALYAQRLAAHHVGVFEIRPGVIRTDMTAVVQTVYEEKIAAGLLPQPRMGQPSDVAAAVRAIAGGLLDYSTGQIINVDGGFHLRSL